MVGVATVGTALGEWLAEAIRAAGYETQEAFADAADLSPTQISEYVRGRRRPSWQSLERMAEALRLPVGELAARVFGGAPPEPARDTPPDALDRMVAKVRADAAAVADIRQAGPDVDENAIRIGADLLKVYLRGLRG
jgi:transcriptional regulator with XRE-family HTH domain